MTSFKSLAIGLTTVAALGTVTAAVASAPIGSERENLDPEKAAHIQEVRNAMQAGDMELARQLKDQYGLKGLRKGHHGKRMRHAFMKLDDETQEAVKAALSSGDYAAFIAAVGEDKAEKLTEERFTHMVEVHELRVAGETEKARELAKEYGLKRPKHMKRPGRGMKFHRDGFGGREGEHRGPWGEEQESTSEE